MDWTDNETLDTFGTTALDCSASLRLGSQLRK